MIPTESSRNVSPMKSSRHVSPTESSPLVPKGAESPWIRPPHCGSRCIGRRVPGDLCRRSCTLPSIRSAWARTPRGGNSQMHRIPLRADGRRGGRGWAWGPGRGDFPLSGWRLDRGRRPILARHTMHVRSLRRMMSRDLGRAPDPDEYRVEVMGGRV
jgi:hypothetical protein